MCNRIEPEKKETMPSKSSGLACDKSAFVVLNPRRGAWRRQCLSTTGSYQAMKHWRGGLDKLNVPLKDKLLTPYRGRNGNVLSSNLIDLDLGPLMGAMSALKPQG